MESALYDPEAGYYFRPEIALGAQGDFITAPEISFLFGASLANSIKSVFEFFEASENPSILELGAGSGKLAIDILKNLEKLESLPDQYFILERSGALRKIQQENFEKNLSQNLLAKIIWLEELPKENNLIGVILSNEVCDALSVKLFKKNKNFKNKISELYVNLEKNPPEFIEQEPSENLLEAVQHLELELGEFPDGYQSEICLFLKPWIFSLGNILNKGVMIMIDYGYSRSEYYLPQRSSGTLLCYYQHKAYGNPLIRIGEQDITAHVDFTRLAEAGLEAGLDLLGYCPQMMFLADCGIEQIVSEEENLLNRRNALTQLMHPDLMGEKFKVMGFGKNIENIESMRGFGLWDDRHRL